MKRRPWTDAERDLLRAHYADTPTAELAARLGIPARSAYRLGPDVVEELSRLCLNLAKEYPRAVIFAGELCFEDAKWYHRLLHNDIAYAVQRRIRFAGLPMVILPYVLRRESPAPPRVT